MTETATLETTAIAGREYIVTEGMTDSTGRRLYGLFSCEDDARAINADLLSHGSVGADALTADQIELARRNSAAL